MNAIETPQILIVEDEKIVAWDIQERLESLGYAIVAKATSGEAAIIAANQTQPDLVLMDIQLQGKMDGIEAAQIIYRNCNIPVVYLTAHSDDQTLAAATRSNPFGYLLKPFQARELHSAIQIALHRHEQESLANRLQEWLSNSLNSIGHATITTDRDGRVTYMNPPAERLTAWDQADALGELITQVVPLIGLATQTPISHPGLKATDLDGQIRLTSDCLLRSKTGAGIPVRTTATALTTNTGERIGSVIVLQDITLQHRIEVELWERNQQLEQFQSNLLNQVSEQTSQFEQLSTYSQILLELLDEKLLPPGQDQRFNYLLQYLGELLDLDYAWIARYDDAHSQATVIDQYQPEHRPNCLQRTSIVDQSIVLADSPDFYQLLFFGISWVDPQVALLPPVYATIVQPQDQVLICPIIAKQDAGQLPVIIGEVGLITTGKAAWNTPLQIKLITQIISCAASISRQAELEATMQAQKNDLSILNYHQEDFISSISHELKTPLENMHRAIQNAQTLAYTIEPLAVGTVDFRRYQDQLKQHLINQLQVLEEECQSESNLVNNLLNLQAPPTPIATSAMGQIHIEELIGDTVKQFAESARRFQQTITYQIQPPTLQLFSHRSSLQRIVKELLNNAVKYTPPNQQIQLTAQTIGTTFELRVTNTGIQIPDDELVRIFQPFYRIPRSNPWDYCGTGIGLALVQRLAAAIGGTIAVESNAQGTSFRLTLPQIG
jgi:PAS domain S-box-containing protein